MSKRASALLLLLLLFAGSVFFSTTLQSPLLSGLQWINHSWNTFTTGVGNMIEENFEQQQTIQTLRREAELYRQSHLILHEMATEFNALLAENNSTFRYDPRIALVRTIAYANFADMTKLWLQMEDFNASRLYGMVYNETAAGIVTARDGRPLALLNGDYQCTYAVFVGPNKAPGIVRGRNSDTMLVQYIPTWIGITVGDEVVTSGLDHLFFPAIKVGTVKSIELTGGYQNAVIEPYYKGNDPDYFHVITRIR
ncbi:rod shape-determining protein MreC [Sulfurimonas sp. HSL1-2]|uniref:rod shape-determining protein MreC n=1 Tax=Thiomicrolovo zhangzhouensis TaxID=3131933 RepID=UPI0031FA15FD